MGAYMNCKTCGELGDGGGTCDKCANCWEVEGRLEKYAASEVGKLYLRKVLGLPIPFHENVELH